MPISHMPPDYPVMSLEVAKRGQLEHADCPESCLAKAYFDRRVPRLEREAQPVKSSRDSSPRKGAWNIW
ncbi:hypothetical protein [Nocardia sp. NBC_01388]|uniref:hypothetical protein n=1 Tax=Nocardia sp. NBC_01388 TaxID=2903596 RepID=UPI00324CCB9B